MGRFSSRLAAVRGWLCCVVVCLVRGVCGCGLLWGFVGGFCVVLVGFLGLVLLLGVFDAVVWSLVLVCGVFVVVVSGCGWFLRGFGEL